MRAGREAEAGRGAGRAELGQVRDAGLGGVRAEGWRAGWTEVGPGGKGEGLGSGRTGERGGLRVGFWVLLWVFPFYFYLLSHFKSKSNKG